VTWLGLFIIGIKRPKQQSDIRARNHKQLIWLKFSEMDGKIAFVAEQK
jgi:hypothetical protein